jgi:hypothetical protein
MCTLSQPPDFSFMVCVRLSVKETRLTSLGIPKMPQDSPNFPPFSSQTGGVGEGSSLSAARRVSAADGGGLPVAGKRSSLPPGFRHHMQPHQQYNASPLQRALTPPPPDVLGPNDPEPFPSVESLESAGSGQNFHISALGLPTSASSNDQTSPLQAHHDPYQHSHSSSFGSKSDTLEIYCANCGRPWPLRNSFVCTSCICGVCGECVGQWVDKQSFRVQSAN